MKRVDQAGGPSAATLSMPTYGAPDAELVADTERMLAFSFLLGRDHAATPLDLADDPQEIPFEEAVAFMKARVPLTKSEWIDLEPKLRFRAFTVAALSEPDAIERVRQTAIAAVEKGKPLPEFWTEAASEKSALLAGKNSGYWENVYRTNTQTAYNAGRAAEFAATNPEYLEFIGIEDTRQTEICAERSGLILPATHPFWKSNWPPLHFQCRSTVRAIYREEADLLREKNANWDPTPDASITRDPPADGFGGNPIDTGSFWMLTPSMVERATKYGLIDDIKAFAKQLGIRRYTLKGTMQIAKVTAPVTNAAKADTPLVDAPPVFKTVKEAENWIVDNNLADSVSFKGCDLRVVQEWAVSLRSMVSEFPQARKILQFFGTCQERTRKFAVILEERAYAQLIEKGIDEASAREYAKRFAKEAAAKWRTSSNTIAEFCKADGIMGIAVNEKYAKSYEDFKLIRERDVAVGWKPVGTGKVVGTLEHEMGHLLDHVYGLSDSSELQSYRRTLSRKDIAEGLSLYANDNVKEFIAESWSEYRMSESPRTIARTVANLLIERMRMQK